MKKKILIFSPYAYWVCHILFERLISKRFLELGHDVNIIYCDGVLENCDLRKNCLICRSSRMRIDAELDIPAMPMSRFLSDRAETNIINHLNDHEVSHFHYKGIDFSDAVTSTYCSYFRKDKVSFLSEDEREVYRQLLRSSILVYQTLENFYQKYQPNFGILFNGRFFATRIALEFFKQKNIHFVSHEIGVLLDGFQFNFDRNSFYFRHVLENWEKRQHLPISKLDLLNTVKMFREWRLGQNRASLIFIRPDKKDAFIDLIEKKSKKYKKTVLVLTSTTDEFVVIDDYQQYFDSQMDWLKVTIEFLRIHPEYLGIVRIHPNTINKDGKLISMTNFIQEVDGKLPKNVVLIKPTQKTNTYDLMKISDAGVTYGSTTSVEMLAMNKRVLLVRQCIYHFLSFFDKIHSKEEYLEQLEKTITQNMTFLEMKQFYRFMSYYVKERSLLFPYVRFIDHRTSFMNFMNYESISDKSHISKITESMLAGPDALFKESLEENYPDELPVLQRIKYNRRKIWQVVIISLRKNDEFVNGSDPASQLYERLITGHNAIPDVLFVNDTPWLYKEFERLGGYMGYFSKGFRIYYRTLFRLPWFVFVNKLIRRITQRFFRRYYTKNRIVEVLVAHFKPDYIVSFSPETEIEARFGKLRSYRILYMNRNPSPQNNSTEISP